MTEKERAILWLAACTRTNGEERKQLLTAAGSPELLFDEFEKFSKKVLKQGKNGLYISDKASREREVNALLDRLDRKGRFAVTYESRDYPALLTQLSDPPPVLYGEGNRELLNRRKFCIVGSRLTPPWAEKTGKMIAEEISRHFVVVTGLAEGGDSAAVHGAIGSGNLICVLPNGLDECYPASQLSLKRAVREKGLLLSEFPFGEKVHKGSFHLRNRILAGLSEGVLVISAGVHSGTLITVSHALDCGREIFAFPYSIGVKQGEGCNAMLKSGANFVTEAEDILSMYGFCADKKREISLSDEERRILDVLSKSGELHAAVIAERAGVPVYEAASTLSALEVKGLIAKAGGNRYSAL